MASVRKPNEGTIRVIDTAGLAELNFDFSPSAVHIAALDVDLVMVFDDNSKLILPNLAVGLLGNNPPKLNFAGQPVAAQSVVAAIGQVTLADATPSIHLASNDFMPKKPKGPTDGDRDGATGQDGVGGGEPPIPEPPIVSGSKLDKQSLDTETKTGDFSTPPVKEVPAGSLSLAAANSAIVSPSVVTPAKNINENERKASFAFDSVVTGQLFQTVGPSMSDNKIKGETGTGDANTNPDFAVQNAKEVLTGSAAADEIWGEDPATYPQGMAGRSLLITLPSATVTASKVTISGVPDSVTILNATAIGGGRYEMDVDPGNSFTMKLAYKLPPNDATTDSEGFYVGFKYTFSFVFTAVNTEGEKGSITASASVGVRDVSSAADQIGLDPTTGKLIVGLSRDPTGNIIDAGDGDDLIHGAAGADLIDGGDDRDHVLYDLSNDAVSVNLADKKGYLGFARGDTYTNIEDITGSDYNDTLIGDGENNLLSGGKGDDSLAGGAGSNT
jgi:Ca2+-binding RTX toxin-like protein